MIVADGARKARKGNNMIGVRDWELIIPASQGTIKSVYSRATIRWGRGPATSPWHSQELESST